MTPITDRLCAQTAKNMLAARDADASFPSFSAASQRAMSDALETARELESIAEEQHQALRACAAVCAGETMSKSGLVSALELAQKSFARYQQLKEKAK